MKQTTNREYRVWMVWLEEQWNNPSRSDVYAMQVAMEVRRVLSKHPNRIKLDKFRIPFKTHTKRATAADREAATKQAKAVWAARLGIKIPSNEGSTDGH